MSYSLNSGVVVNSFMRSVLQDLADSLSFNIYVTSGIRDARGQARAMLNNKKMFDGMAAAGVVRASRPKIPYDVNYLVDLYADDAYAQAVDDTYPQSPAPYTEDQLQAATAIVQAKIDSGVSGHAVGMAVDIAYYSQRSPKIWLTTTQISEFVSTAQFLDLDVDREFDHFHVDFNDVKKSSAPGNAPNVALLLLPLVALWTLKQSRG